MPPPKVSIPVCYRRTHHIQTRGFDNATAGVKIITLAEGGIGALHVGLKGAMHALYLTDLRQKVLRGLEGRVRQGRSGGDLCYG
jgi:hypothetical protein